MRKTWIVAVIILLLTMPFAAVATSDTADETRKDCKQWDKHRGVGHNDNDTKHEEKHRDCGSPYTIPDTTVGAGETLIFDGSTPYSATGTIIVENGGNVIVNQATINFEPTSNGIMTQPGGGLSIVGGSLNAVNASAFRIVADPTSTLQVTQSRITSGQGIIIATESTTFTNNVIEQIPVAIQLQDVSVVLTGNTFRNNVVSVNQTGGSPTLTGNSFEGGETCVRDWRTNPTITDNVFRGCHIGIWHEESESTITGNDMMDEALPPGVGIAVINTHSPVIENNIITNYGTGILISNARGYVRNNTIFGNVGDGIRIQTNSLPMDIQGNQIYGNGGHGVRLDNVIDVPVWNNDIHHNGGHGIFVTGSPNAKLTDNTIHNSTGYGILISADSAGALIERNVANANALAGIVVLAPNARMHQNTASNNGPAGIIVRGNGTILNGATLIGNTASGLAVQFAAGVDIDNVVSTDNGNFGVEVRFSPDSFDKVNASRNARSGVWFDTGGAALPMSNFRGLVAIGNTEDGFPNQVGARVNAHNSWFQGNAGFGVRNADPMTTIDFSSNYWGHATGPKHAANTAGLGDRVSGGVTFLPFLLSPPAQ